MTREEKIAEARRLREGGALLKDIATRFGVSQPTAYRWTAPGGLERDRERSLVWKRANPSYHRVYEEAHPGSCDSCGGHCFRRARLCQSCEFEGRRDGFRATGEKLVRLWGEGKVYSEIMAEMGWSKGRLSVALHTYRTHGYDLPYRRTGEALENIRRANRSREQVAA